MQTARDPAMLSTYHVDFLVRDSSPFGKTMWVWRQFIVKGDSLAVISTKKGQPVVVATVPVAHCTLTQVPSSRPNHDSTPTFILADGRKPTSPILTLSIPSATRLAKFQAVLRIAASSPQWTLPPPNAFQELVDVAKCISETHQTNGHQGSAAPTTVTKDAVASYLHTMQRTHEQVSLCTSKEQFLGYLQQLEADYTSDRHAATATFAYHVHRLYPVDFKKAGGSADWTTFQHPMATCPHSVCKAPLSPDAVFDMRVLGLAVECPTCRAIISTDTFRLAQFLLDVPSVATTTHYVTNDIPMPHLPRDGTKDSFMKLMARTVYNYETLTHHPFPKSERMQLDARFASYFEPLDFIHAMACHVQFMAPICANLTYWTDPAVLDASVVRYSQFLHCVRHASSPLMPTTDIALVRVVHQSLDGTLPFFDLPSTPDALKVAYADTFLAWSDLFNEAYSSYVPDYTSWMAAKAKNPIQRASLKKKWAKLMRVPSWNCRFVGVDETYVDDSVPQVTAVEVTGDIDLSGSDASVAVAQGFVAVIGTPMTDDRAQLPAQVAALLKPKKGRAGLAYSSGNKVVDAIDRAFNMGYTGY